MATQAEVADHLDLTQQAVAKLLSAGHLPRSEGRGSLDLDACRIAYIRRLREQAAGRASEGAEEEGGLRTAW
jgi:phage terminase Nu1 subunit (DNA packaging protein)